MTSQKHRILRALNLDGGLCAMDPLRWTPSIYRVAARINDLREEGYEIITRQPCHRHREPQHHAMYVLVTADQRSLF